MLVEFRVKNFRSLRDEQVLSMVASKDKTLQDTHTIATGIKAAPTLLRSAVIYGANASGKSNLIKALQYMRGVVIESASVIQPGQTYAVQPFRLDAESARLDAGSIDADASDVMLVSAAVNRELGVASVESIVVLCVASL